MTDPRLNSMHLDNLRREDFRRARDELLGARGERTRLGELAAEPAPPESRSRTEIVHPDGPVSPGQQFALLEGETVYPLKLGINTVGRLPDNDVVILDPFISRRHCAILVHQDQRCELHDVASKNGTFLNGQPLRGPTPLVSGDQIRICDRLLTFLNKSHPAARGSGSKTQAG